MGESMDAAMGTVAGNDRRGFAAARRGEDCRTPGPGDRSRGLPSALELAGRERAFVGREADESRNAGARSEG